MCVKILKSNCQEIYDPAVSFKEQVVGADKIIVDYAKKDKTIAHFIKELRNCKENGTKISAKIDVMHHDNIEGFKVKNAVNKIVDGMVLNEFIKLAVSSQKEIDQKLEDIQNICTGNKCDV